MRKAVEIRLTAEEEKKLKAYAKGRKNEMRLMIRAQIVLLAAEGLTNVEIARRMDVNRILVGRWRQRFAEKRLAGIEKELPRGGNHGGHDSEEMARRRVQVVEATTQEAPPGGESHWSCRSMAAHVGMSKSFVHKVWQKFGLKPHKIRTFKVSGDPNFVDKLCDVVGLYLNPPEHAAVFSFDEKTSIQALDRTQPGLPLKKGRCGTMTHDYKRHGTTTLFAAMNLANGEVVSETYRRHRHEEFLRFLRLLNRTVPRGQEIHIILDNYSTHKHREVLKWLEQRKRIYLHFIPTSSSWLNLVESFFAKLTKQHIKRSAYTSVAHLEACLKEYVENHNKVPQPFVWTKSADEILEKIERAKMALPAH